VDGLPIRLDGLAAPERDEPGGRQTTAAMVELVAGQRLRCVLDGKHTYDRCVAICYLEGRVAAAMVRLGLARDCPTYSGGRYAVAERAAAAAGATIGRSYQLPGYCRPR
jgi:endonuclease YncB( thermonuclease family)